MFFQFCVFPHSGTTLLDKWLLLSLKVCTINAQNTLDCLKELYSSKDMQKYLFHPFSSPPFSAPPELILLRRLSRLEKKWLFTMLSTSWFRNHGQTNKKTCKQCLLLLKLTNKILSYLHSNQKRKKSQTLVLLDLLWWIIRMKYALLTSSESNPLIGLGTLQCREAPWQFGRVPCKSPEGRPWSWDSVHKLASLPVGGMPCRAWNSSPRHSCSICHLNKGRSCHILKHYSWKSFNFPIKRKMLELQSAASLEATCSISDYNIFPTINDLCTLNRLTRTLKKSLWKAGLESELMSWTVMCDRQWSNSREKPPTDWSLWRRTKSNFRDSC